MAAWRGGIILLCCLTWPLTSTHSSLVESPLGNPILGHALVSGLFPGMHHGNSGISQGKGVEKLDTASMAFSIRCSASGNDSMGFEAGDWKGRDNLRTWTRGLLNEKEHGNVVIQRGKAGVSEFNETGLHMLALADVLQGIGGENAGEQGIEEDVERRWKFLEGKDGKTTGSARHKSSWKSNGYGRVPRDQQWEYLFCELSRYKQLFGHVLVPQGSPPAGSVARLASWVNRQRMRLRSGSLSQDRYDRLAGIGMVWEQKEGCWEECYKRLERFVERNGHPNVPQEYVDSRAGDGYAKGDTSLGMWVASQRLCQKRGKLRKDRFFRLSLLGFQWEVRHDWDTNYGELLLHIQQCGGVEVPRERKSLRRWVEQQRNLLTANKVSREKAWLLGAAGLNVSLYSDAWEKYFSASVCFKQKHGHLNIKDDMISHDNVAALPFDDCVRAYMTKWLMQQRQLFNRGALKECRAARLEMLGLPLSSYISNWNARYAELLDFFAENGHVNVPSNFAENPSLATWVKNQRRCYKNGNIRDDRRAKLDAICFCWVASEDMHTQQRYSVSNSRGKKRHKSSKSSDEMDEGTSSSSSFSLSNVDSAGAGANHCATMFSARLAGDGGATRVGPATVRKGSRSGPWPRSASSHSPSSSRAPAERRSRTRSRSAVSTVTSSDGTSARVTEDSGSSAF